MRKLLIILLSVLLSLSLISCKKEKNNDEVIEEQTDVQNDTEENQENTFLDTLNKKVEDGQISKDDYLACTLLGVFDVQNIPQAYRKESIEINDLNPFIEYAEENWDELSDETRRALAETLTCSFIEFKKDQSVGFFDNVKNALFEKVEALADEVIIDQVVQSESGRFNIWYSDTDSDSATKEEAQKVARWLDEASVLYDACFDTQFRYVDEIFYVSGTTFAQQHILRDNGYDPNDLQKCMNVYLCDYTDSSVKAVCASGFRGFLEELVIPFLPKDKFDSHGIKTYPYILIDSDQPFDTQMKQIIYHELFHYYQNDVLREEACSCDIVGKEATANWASVLNAPIEDNTVDIGGWNGKWQMRCSNWFDQSKELQGYGLIRMLYHYTENVENGFNKIIEALYEEDFIHYLEDSSTVEERNNLMCNLAYHGFVNDYDNPAMRSKNSLTGTLYLSESNPQINCLGKRMSVNYYRVDVSMLSNPALQFSSSNASASLLLFAKYKDGHYERIDDTLNGTTVFLLTHDDMIENFYAAVTNGDFMSDCFYSLRIGEEAVLNESNENVSSGNAGSNNTAKGNDMAIEETVLVDDGKLKIVAMSAKIANNSQVRIECRYENKTDERVAFKINQISINGYTCNGRIIDCSGEFMIVEPKKNGIFTINACFSYFYEFPHDNIFPTLSASMNSVPIKALGVGIKVGHVEGESHCVSDYECSPVPIKTASYDAAAEDFDLLQSYGTSNEELGLKKRLIYQPINQKYGNFTILSAAVYELMDGSQGVLIEIRNDGAKQERLSVAVKELNNIGITGDSAIVEVLPGCKSLDLIYTGEYSGNDRLPIYGLNSIGSYTLKFGGLYEMPVTLTFGAVSPITGKQVLLSGDNFTLSLVGSGVRQIGERKYEKDTVLNFYLDMVNPESATLKIDDIVVDGKKFNRSYNVILNDYLVEVTLENIDPGKQHTATAEVCYEGSDGVMHTEDITIRF